LGDAHSAVIGMWLDTGDDIDGVAEDVLTPVDDIAEVDTDPKRDVLASGSRVALAHRLLYLEGASHGVEGAREFNQGAVTERLHRVASERRGDRANDLVLLMCEVEGKLLVPLGQEGIADHVGEHHGG
jgi:hypothetical protein